MARTKQTGRRAPKPPKYQTQHHRKTHDPALIAAQEEAERRERILADRRRTEAKWRPKVPEVRKVTFENFKNRLHDLDEPDYAVEALVGGPNLQGQIRREQASRRKEEVARNRQNWLKTWAGIAKESARFPQPKRDVDEKVRRERKAEAVPANGNEFERVRISSQPVLGHLTSLINDTEHRSTPRTFMRPFKALIYFQPKMKDILATLEEKWADFEQLDEDSDESEKPEEIVDDAHSKGTDSNSEAKEDDDDTESLMSVDSEAEDLDTIMDSVEALRDMRCYVNFIDNEIIPTYNRYNETDEDRVKFDDLWCLFRPGDLVYMPSAGEPAGRYHEVWRIYKVEVPQPETVYEPKFAWEFFGDETERDEKVTFNIFAYYIDHDGTSFGAVRHMFRIESFAGERQVDSLEVFPIRYRPGHEQLLESLKDQGRNFQKFLGAGDRHQQYNAWTLTRNPPCNNDNAEDEILRDDDNEEMRHPEFVESDVIVDLAEAYQKNPDWRPNFHHPTLNKSIRCEVEFDDMQIQQWLNGSRGEIAYSQDELVQKVDGVETWQRRENLNTDLFLRQRVQGSRTYEMKPQVLELREDDLVLLPKRMFAYALRERRFVAVNINFLKPIRRQQGVFENLKILRDYKDIVRGLVASHFQKKALERCYADQSTEGPSQDLIQGKGRGLVVLLHGVPGVGKTATAEAVAMENRKPLFVITCGDLGLTASEVESSLSNVFRLAHLWDCVLLLDEADVFLSQRSRVDMKRNALVSVFLRVLEYYNGLLFLTTNRVGTIDEAFKSRIHMSLYYPPLDKSQTRDIFRLNVAKLREIEAQRHAMTGEPQLQIKDAEIVEFAGRHFDENARGTGCWNGRQIRNAFQIASSLAHHHYSNEVEAARATGVPLPRAPVLDRGLFEKVQMSTQSFDRHMKESKGVDLDLPLRSTFYEEGRRFE